jgi:hypothetical protein
MKFSYSAILLATTFMISVSMAYYFKVTALDYSGKAKLSEKSQISDPESTQPNVPFRHRERLSFSNGKTDKLTSQPTSVQKSVGASENIDSVNSTRLTHDPKTHAVKDMRHVTRQGHDGYSKNLSDSFWPHKLSISKKSINTNGPYSLPQAAVWVDTGDLALVQSGHDLAIQKEAEQLAEKISNSGFAPDSAEYLDFWNASVAESDQRFRQRYGGWAWMSHHVQAHHLAAGNQSNTK